MGFVFHLHYWPILTAVWFAITFITAYLISVLNGHVYPFFPYISDTGTKIPESCWFGQMLNIGALCMAVTMYIRYKQIELAIKSEYIDLNQTWNVVTKWLGFLACLGMSIVANFQMTAIGIMHFFGAILAFGLGSLYFILQSRITDTFRRRKIKNAQHGIGDVIFYARVFMGAVFLPLFITNTVTSAVSMSRFDGDTVIWWTSEHKAYDLHLLSTFAEWILAILMLVYVLTFIKEFKLIELEAVKFKNKLK